MKEHTVVFDKITANLLLSQGYQIESIEDNKHNPYEKVYIFKGDIEEAKRKILKDMGII